VLTGASDGDGEIQVGCNFLTSLSDLKGWWHPTGVTSSARRGELAPNISASGFNSSLKGSGPPIPRPPETITRASSKRCSFVNSRFTFDDSCWCIRKGGLNSTQCAYPARLVVSRGANERDRVQSTAGLRLSSITAWALPPYTCRVDTQSIFMNSNINHISDC
jgi:hypothetical protein